MFTPYTGTVDSSIRYRCNTNNILDFILIRKLKPVADRIIYLVQNSEAIVHQRRQKTLSYKASFTPGELIRVQSDIFLCEKVNSIGATK